MSGPDEFPLYRDRDPDAAVPATGSAAGSAASSVGPAVPGQVAGACPTCGGTSFEEGFVEGTSDSLVRYYAAPREDGLFGVKRFGLERRPVSARRCRGCSRLDLFAPHPD